MKIDQVPRDRKAKAEPAVSTGGGGISLAKWVEHVRQELRGNANTRIGNGNHQIVLIGMQAHVNATAFGRELDCIAACAMRFRRSRPRRLVGWQDRAQALTAAGVADLPATDPLRTTIESHVRAEAQHLVLLVRILRQEPTP
jgi:hypothetical protein